MNANAAKDSRRAAHSYFRRNQMRIAAEAAAPDIDFDLRPLPRSIGNRFGQLPVGISFIGCPGVDRAVRPRTVVPISKYVQPMLDAPLVPAQESQPQPELKRSEEPFAFAVQKGCPDTGSDLPDALPSHGFAKLFPELRTVIGDDEFWLAAACRRAEYQRDGVPGTARLSIDFERNNVPRVTVYRSAAPSGKFRRSRSEHR